MAIPKPGEIWTIRRNIAECVPSRLLEHHRFSDPARHFTQGHGPSRYVMIVGDVRLLSEYSRHLTFNDSTAKTELKKCNEDDFAVALMNPYWVSVMVLGLGLGNHQSGITLEPHDPLESPKKVSSVDVLIPAHISGLDHNVIAETWHIVPMLVHQLSDPVGHRFSSTLYNHLMDMGDTAFNKDRPTSPYLLTSNQLQSFHRMEQQWSEVLRVPITACNMQFERLAKTTAIMEQAIWLERFSL